MRPRRQVSTVLTQTASNLLLPSRKRSAETQTAAAASKKSMIVTHEMASSPPPPPTSGDFDLELGLVAKDRPLWTASSTQTSPSRANAALESGTRCSLPAFMRLAGIVQAFASRSISDQVAPRVSPDRAAVNIVKPKARADTPSRVASCPMKSAISA